MTATPAPSEAADLLYGVAAISAVLGLTERQAKHRIAKGEIPTFRMGRMLCATRTGLRAWIAEREAAGRHTLAAPAA